MNDCFWCFINGVCDCNDCGNCNEYISVNSEKGMELYAKYEIDVEEALKPIAEMSWEKPIDWSKVEVDTKILVRNSEDDYWHKRYLAKYENGKVYAWADGTTSFTVLRDYYINAWDFAKLAEEGDQNG